MKLQLSSFVRQHAKPFGLLIFEVQLRLLVIIVGRIDD
jgi:hypothetical protein